MLVAGDPLHVQGNAELRSTLVYNPLQAGPSPLHAVAQEGHLQVAQVLLEGGADVNQANQVLCLHMYMYHRVHTSVSIVPHAV